MGLRKLSLFTFFCIFLSIVGLKIVLYPDSNSKEVENDFSYNGSSENLISPNYEEILESEEKDRQGLDEQDGMRWASEGSLHSFNQFRREQGYGLSFEESDYQSYSIDTLESLSASSDYAATHILAKKMLESGDYPNALLYYEKAAVLNSTFALKAIAGVYESAYYQSDFSGDSGSKKAALTGVLAHYEVAVMRGDLSGEKSKKLFLEENNVVLTEAMNRDVSEAANTIYDNLSEQRKALGLGEFDNSVPEKVLEYFNEVNSEN